MWGALQVLSPAPPASVEVLVAARDLPAGSVLEAADLEPAAFAPATVPSRIDPRPAGRTLASPLTRGEPVTEARLAAPGLSDHLGGRTGVPVRVADADVVRLLRVGDRVDVAATDPRGGGHERVARSAVVLALPTPPEGPGSPSSEGRLVLLAVRPGESDAVVAASATELIHLLWTQPDAN